MTHHTDAERAEFEAWARDRYPSINLARDGDGYSKSLAKDYWSLWQAARRAPAVPVPQGWRLVPEWPTVEMSVAGDDVYRKDGPDVFSSNTIYTRMLAAAPQPPEAAPVQFPEPVGVANHGQLENIADGYAYIYPADSVGATCKLYTEQQVRELLANHGIQEQST